MEKRVKIITNCVPFEDKLEEKINTFLSENKGKLHDIKSFSWESNYISGTNESRKAVVQSIMLIYTPEVNCEGKMAKKKTKGEKKIKKVMHEFKEGELHSGSKKGPVVTNPKQAVAISLSEARKAGAKIPKKTSK